ncbi:MAG: two-component regulator propeller domain-containing protein [Bacteroidota bacterium]
MGPISKSKASSIIGIISIIAFSFFLSCSDNNKKNLSEKKKTDLSPPKTISITNPIITNLDTCRAPRVVQVPTKAGGSYTINGKKESWEVKLLPPVTVPAGFLAKMKIYNTEEGLNISGISGGYKDRSGNLWFGSYGGGVSRYDGKTFTSFTTTQGLGDNVVNSIIEDRKGNMWFCTPGNGVSCYDGRSIKNITTDQGLIDNGVYCITEDNDGDLWFGTTKGVSRYNGKTFKNYTTEKGLAHDVVSCILKDKKGNLWFCTAAGASYFDGRIFTNYTTEQGLMSNSINCATEDMNGNIWLGTDAGEISKFDGRAFTNFKFDKGQITCITEGKNGNIWFGTQKKGAMCYDGKTFINFTMEQGLVNDVVNSIVEDKSGNIWIGTYGGGISRYDGKSFSSYTAAQGLGDNVIWSIVEDNSGKLWFGTYTAGVSCYDGKSFTHYTMEQGLGERLVFSSTKDSKGNLWFGTRGGGVSCYDGKSFTTYTKAHGLADNTVWNIKEDKKGNMWFGTGEGISSFNGKSFITYREEHGLAQNEVYGIAEDNNGNLWFGTDGGGVSCYDGKSFTNYTTAQGLVNNMIYAIFKDKNGNMWMGSYGGGLSRYDGKSFKKFTTSNGLADDNVTQLSEDKNGAIWIATNCGFSKLNFKVPEPSENKKPIIPGDNSLSNEDLEKYLPAFETYNQRTGYPVKDVNVGQNCMLIDSKGIVWAGTGDVKTGLVRFDPSALNHNLAPPALVIHSLKLNEDNISWHGLKPAEQNEKDSTTTPPNIVEEVNIFGRTLTDIERDTMRKQFADVKFDSVARFYSIPENLVLPYNHNNITFEFAAVEPARSFLVRYQYMLEGYDKDWSRITNKTTATFGNIFEGEYIFKVKAQSPEGIWSEPVTYTFKVLPPWYRTWWMYSSEGVAGFLLLFGLYRWRTSSLRKDKERLETTVKERTSEVIRQKEEAEEQKHIVEEKQREILDSIHYAKKIQEALLQEEEHISMHLPAHFILFKPKDIISGDFYWSLEKHDHLYLAAVDCTGHGVPGAMMSMLGIAFLNEITSLEQLLSPAEILNQLREKVVKELGSSGQTKDGMDISLCRINLKTYEVEWSGANNPLWIIKEDDKGKKHIQEIKADKQHIGYNEVYKPFTNHTLKIRNCNYYLFTDGYADQFGGTKGKKFMHKPLKERLISVIDQPMELQKKALLKTFEDWKGDLAQVDDVCLIGIHIS